MLKTSFSRSPTLLLRTSPALTHLTLRCFYYPDANHHHLNQEVPLLIS